MKTEWISIKDRLPDHGIEVFTYPDMDKGYIVDGIWKQRGNEIGRVYDIEVTHWMPLPEPPNKEDGYLLQLTNSSSEIQRLTTENKELEEKLMSEQIENGYLQGFRVSNESEIQRLTKEVEELKNDLLDALDLKNGNGPTALTMLSNEITRLRELVTQYLDNSTSDNAYGADVRTRILNELSPKP